MSLIQIADLDLGNDLLITLADTHIATIVGGAAPSVSMSIPGARIAPYNASYSLSLANLNKVNILTVGSSASFDASFMIDGQNSKRVVSGSIGYNSQINSPYAKLQYSK
jgi:hypothetical protein